MSKKTMQDLWKEMTKQHGEEGLFHGNDQMTSFVDVISTGSYALDDALGIWGLPRGRLIQYAGQESSGKTYMSLIAIAEYQRQNPDGWALFIDAEFTFDSKWAEGLGVDLERLMIYRENSGIKIFERLIGQPSKTGAKKAKLGILDFEKENPTGLGIIVLDSIASVQPPAEETSEVGKANMALMARFLPPELRKLTPMLSDTGVTMIVINQIRLSPGVMYGCLGYDTKLNFADGRSIPIGKVVEEKIEGDVYCFNEENGCIETKPIIDWHYNGDIDSPDDFMHIKARGVSTSNGVLGVRCTHNHKILTNSGWKKASDVSKNDKLITRYVENINGTLGQFMSGVLSGDSHISTIRERNTSTLFIQDNVDTEYSQWKVNKLSKFMRFGYSKNYRYPKYSSSSFGYELLKLKEKYPNRDTMNLLDNYSDLGLSIVIMDDASLDESDGRCRYTLSVKRFKRDVIKLEQLVDKFDSLGFGCRASINSGNIIFDEYSSKLIASKIKKFVPPCMQHKLPNQYKGMYVDFELENNPTTKVAETEVLEINPSGKGRYRTRKNRMKFDISVKDNHNYMVGSLTSGIVVHNSPETTPGGTSLKHNNSMMLNFSRIAAKDSVILDDNGERIGHHVRVRVDKNKLAPPFRVAELAITYFSGVVEHNIELRDLGAKYGVIERPNNKTWMLDDVKYNGKDAIAEALADKDMQADVFERVKEAKKNSRNNHLVAVDLDEVSDED